MEFNGLVFVIAIFVPGIITVINCLNECGDDLAPTEGWSDRRQNCLLDMCIVGNTELIWNGQQ